LVSQASSEVLKPSSEPSFSELFSSGLSFIWTIFYLDYLAQTNFVFIARVSLHYVLSAANYLSVSISGVTAMDLNYDNHLEVHLLPTKKNPPPKNDNPILTVVTISISVTITLALELTGVIDLNKDAEAFPPRPIIEKIDGSQGSGNEDDFINPQIPPPNPPDRNAFPPNCKDADLNKRVRIDRCHGVRYEGANFRDYPAMTPHAIKGAVLPGEWVVLTGVTNHRDGILWYEVINESPLTHSLEAYTYVPAPNQYGWIASCFIE